MQRAHLVELEDLPWVPRPVRDGGTDLLDFLFARTGFYRAAVPVLERALAASGASAIVDLCSGGGGGALFMAGELAGKGIKPRVTLTDRHPNEAAFERVAAAGLEYHREAIDAASVPSTLPGLRTMFGALHHFRPEEVSALLTGLVARGAHVAFFDVGASPIVRKTPALLMPLAAIPNVVMLSILPLVMVPFVRPFRLSRVVLTYLLPLIPFLFAWDGTVSALRAYAPGELLALARAVPGGEKYAWDAGMSGQAVWLTGRPA